MGVLSSTESRLTDLAKTHHAVLVFYSGGKDSMAAMDLCVCHFRKVVGVFMYFVPGLDVVESRLDIARQRWNIDFICVPHWMLGRFFRRGIYCFPDRTVPEVKLPAVYASVREKTGVQLIVTGGKASDGAWRRRYIKNASDNVIHPLETWNKFDVLHYLSSVGLEAPEKFDLDLSTPSVLWLHDNHHADYLKLLAWFPHAASIVKRRDLYGAN